MKILIFLLIPFLLFAQKWGNSQSLYFDGGDYLNKEIANFRSGDGTGTFSIWFKYDVVGDEFSLISGGDDDAEIYMSFHKRSNEYTRTIYNPDGVSAVHATTNVPYLANTWYHVVYTSDNSDWNTYINNSLIQDGLGDSTWFDDFSTLDHLTFGAREYNGSILNYHVGHIAQISYFSTELTAAEVKELYNSGTPFDVRQHSQSDSLKHFWPIEEGTGTTTEDVIDTLDLVFGDGSTSTTYPAWQDSVPGTSDTGGMDFYIDATSGSDSNKGWGSADSAWQTISKVNATTFYQNDNIYFKRGETWREQLTVPSSGTSGNVITFSSYGSGDKPLIDSTGTLIDFNSQDYVTLENLELRNGLVQINTGTNNTIRYCEFDSADANALLLDGTSNTVYYNLFLNATTDAIEVDSVSNTIYNNVIYNNGNGVDVDTSVTFRNNIVNTSGTNDINIATGVTVTGGYNCFEDAAKAGSGTYSGTSLWSTDPLFTNAPTNFIPKNSALDKAGVDVGLTLDYALKSVTSPPDIGAYQFSLGYQVRYKRTSGYWRYKRH